MIDLLQNELKRVAIEPTARVDRQRRGLVQDQDGLVLMHDAHGGLDDAGLQMKIAFPGPHRMRRRDRLALAIEQRSRFAAQAPFVARNVLQHAGQKIEQRRAVPLDRHGDRFAVVIRNGARQRIGRAGDLIVAFADRLRHLLGRGGETIGTGLAGNVARVALLFRAQRREAAVALRALRFAQCGIDPDALVEDKTFAVVVRAAALLEIFQDAAIELEDVEETFPLHVGTGLFAANAARAKHHDRVLLHPGGKFPHRIRELAKMVEAQDLRAAKRAELHLVIVARVEQRHGPPLVEPLLERRRRNLARRFLLRLDALHAERDDFLFDPDQHPVERLVLAHAHLRRQILQPRDRAQLGQQQPDLVRAAGDEEVDALAAQQDRSFESPRPALLE